MSRVVSQVSAHGHLFIAGNNIYTLQFMGSYYGIKISSPLNWSSILCR